MEYVFWITVLVLTNIASFFIGGKWRSRVVDIVGSVEQRVNAVKKVL